MSALLVPAFISESGMGAPGTPTPPYTPQIRLYQEWLQKTLGLHFATYEALWQWSVQDLEGFWRSIWDYFGLHSPTPCTHVLIDKGMPDVQWFVGAQVNYAQQVLRHVEPASAAGMPAIICENELAQVNTLSWRELERRVAAVALHLKRLGVQRGERVAAYLPNFEHTIVCALATFSIGAIWSVCAPDMGVAAVLDRFGQITPKVLIAADGVHYAGKGLDRASVIDAMVQDLPSVQNVLVFQTPFAHYDLLQKHAGRICASGGVRFDSLARLWTEPDAAVLEQSAQFAPEPVPFDHPLWIVYSSGTTGLPKPIVHGHGGILLTLLALKCLGNDIGCSYSSNSWGERFHWYSSTGWVMWNAQMAGLATGTTIVLYDGAPSGNRPQHKTVPDWSVLWRFAARHQVTFFGAGAAFYSNCMKAALDLSQCGDLSRVRALGSTGSPLPEEVQRWGTEQFAAGATRHWGCSGGTSTPAARSDIWWCNISGGTDFCGAFIGGNRELPLVPGQMQCRLLGCAVQAWDEHGQPVSDAVGELVCTRPIPSMPLYFWGDRNRARYLGSYFDLYPGVWRHGDWLRIGADGQCIIYGRSDATINRFGLRMGTSEIYSAVESLPQVLDSMVVDLEYLGQKSEMLLFVVLRDAMRLDETLTATIHTAIKTALSPRFVPDSVHQVSAIPRTLSGKKQELPIKKLLLGQPIARLFNRDAMANPECLQWYEAFAKARGIPANSSTQGKP